MRVILTGTILLLSLAGNAQGQLRFSSLDSLLIYASDHSASIRTGDKQALLAKATKLTAIGNVINLRCPLSASFIDNTELPVNYVPGEFFGGPPGSTRELTLGQEYVTNYSISPQLDIINPSAWPRLKSASVNARLTEVTNLVNKKALYENISATWFNILSLQEQIAALSESVKAADSIVVIAERKTREGIIREQEKNNVLANALTVTDRKVQSELLLEQQYSNIKVLCDIDTEINLVIGPGSEIPESLPVISANNLSEKQSQLQATMLRSELRAGRTSLFAPTVSLVFSQGWQESSNKQFFDPDANRFSTQYYGLRLSLPFPLEAIRLSQSYTAKINYQIAEINYLHAQLQADNSNKQLLLNYNSALSTHNTHKKISDLKKQNYRKSLNQYQEGILGTELLLTAFTDNINAGLNEISARANLQQAISKIRINNTIQ